MMHPCLSLFILTGKFRQFSKKIGSKQNAWNPKNEIEINEESRKRERALAKLEKARQLASEVDQISFKDITDKTKKKSFMNDTLPGQGKCCLISLTLHIG